MEGINSTLTGPSATGSRYYPISLSSSTYSSLITIAQIGRKHPGEPRVYPRSPVTAPSAAQTQYLAPWPREVTPASSALNVAGLTCRYNRQHVMAGWGAPHR